MADYTRNTFVPKYAPQAEGYNNSVTKLKEKLVDVQEELDKVDDTLGLDPENAHDILTYNVIIGNAEIKDEVEALVNDLDFYTGEITDAADRFDKDDKAEFEAAEDRRIADLKAQDEAKPKEEL